MGSSSIEVDDVDARRIVFAPEPPVVAVEHTGIPATDGKAAHANLSAAQIVEKYVAARGGRKAWNALQTMAWVGHMESNRLDSSAASFVMEMKRPDKTRFELNQQGHSPSCLRWREWLEPAPEPAKALRSATSARGACLRDGRLRDGRAVDAVPRERCQGDPGGRRELEGQKAYRLNLVLPSGARRQSWIDARTYLELRYDRSAVDASQRPVTMSVYYRITSPSAACRFR